MILISIFPGFEVVTVCPGSSPHDGCVTIDHLTSRKLLKSNTIFKFEPRPATFELQPDSFIAFENVSNITLESTDAYNVSIFCVRDKSGFILSKCFGISDTKHGFHQLHG